MPVVTQLPWFPPAPAGGPAPSALFTYTPPDDWIMELKLDGVRVIWYRGEPYTRHGKILSPAKGADLLRETLAGVDATLDGEWIARSGVYYLFDLPDHDGVYDARRQALAARFNEQYWFDRGVQLTATFPDRFRENYDLLHGHAEGVVMKRRMSLYPKQRRPGVEARDWALKRRFAWDVPTD